MEADRLHGVDQYSLNFSTSHMRNPMKIHKPYDMFGNPNSKGLLKSPPPSLPHYHRQPPLLPLPATHDLRRSSSTIGQYSYYPPNRNGPTRHHSFTLKKYSSKIPTEEEKKKTPKRYSDVMFEGPPPSSLPLPTFCLRPKPMIGRNAGASDDLRRLQ